MQRYIVTRVLKVVDKITGKLVHALTPEGNTIPLAGYFQGPGKPHLLAQRNRGSNSDKGYLHVLDRSSETTPLGPRVHARAQKRLMRKLAKKATKPLRVAQIRQAAKHQRRDAA